MITKDKWIKCEERMPEDRVWVLAYRSDPIFEQDRIIPRRTKNGEFDTIYPVTHWMPMPRQPQCFEGGPEKGCSCPDHGKSLIDI